MTLDLLCCSDPGGHKLISCWGSRHFVWTTYFGHPLLPAPCPPLPGPHTVHSDAIPGVRI